MSDYMEVSEEGWLTRIGNSIVGVLVGIVLFLVSFVLLFWNEGNYVRDLEASAELREKTIEVKPETIDPANNGKPVFFTGKAVVAQELADQDFGIAGKYVHLNRTVEMYQWEEEKTTRKEKQLGGSEKTVTEYTYKLGWHKGRIESGSFKTNKTKEGVSTANPSLPFESKSQSATTVTVGAFTLSEGLVGQINTSKPVSLKAEDAAKVKARVDRPSPAMLPPEGQPMVPDVKGPDGKAPAPDVKAPAPKGAVQPQQQQPPMYSPAPADKSARRPAPAEEPRPLVNPNVPPTPATVPAGSAAPKIADGKYVYFGADPANPKLGDIRVSFTITEPGDVSVLAAQQDGKLVPYTAANGKTRELLSEKVLTKEGIIAEDEFAAGMLVWILRFVGFIVMAIGAYLVVAPIATIADVIPFLGDIVGAGLFLAALVLSAFLSLITIAVAWLFYRPLYGLALIGVGLVILVAAKVLFGGSKPQPTKAY